MKERVCNHDKCSYAEVGRDIHVYIPSDLVALIK